MFLRSFSGCIDVCWGAKLDYITVFVLIFPDDKIRSVMSYFNSRSKDNVSPILGSIFLINEFMSFIFDLAFWDFLFPYGLVYIFRKNIV